MALPLRNLEEFRTAFILMRLCLTVRSALPARHGAAADLLAHCGELTLLIANASSERTRLGCARKLAQSRDHIDAVATLLRGVARRRRALRASVSAALEIAERLGEQLTRRIDRLQSSEP